MKHTKLLIALCIGLLIAGCVPTRYSWSPDGKWMTAIGDDGLHISDASGNLIPAVVPNVNIATWFPDSHRILVSQQVTAEKWDDLTKYLTPEQIKIITDGSARVFAAMLAYDWSDPKTNDFDHFKTWMQSGNSRIDWSDARWSQFTGPVVLYVCDHATADLQKKLPPQRWSELQGATVTVNCVEIATLSGSSITVGKPIWTTLDDIHDLRVSPNGLAATIDTKGESDHSCNLYVTGLNENATPVLLSDQASWFADWSPQGTDVAFIRAASPAKGDEQRLGSLSRVTVIGDDGKLIDKPVAPQDLVGLIFDELLRVRWLNDGRIVFSAGEVTLPATTADLPGKPQLFALTPGTGATVTRLIPRQSVEEIGDAAQFFEISPDGNFASIPDQKGRVTIVDLRDGSVKAVQDKPVQADANNNGTLMTVPQWRSDDELTYIAPDSAGKPYVALWSMKKDADHPLSTNWPAGLIQENKSATQPATQP